MAGTFAAKTAAPPSKGGKARRASLDRSPAHASEMLRLHLRAGNRATGLLLQAKLRIGAPNDRYEVEADRIADTVMATPDPGAERVGVTSAGASIQPCSCGGSCASCAGKEEEPMVQRCSCGGSCASCAAHGDDLLVQRRSCGAQLAERPETMVRPFAISRLSAAAIQRESADSCTPKEDIEEGEKAEEAEEALETGEAEEPDVPADSPGQTTVQPKGRTAEAPVPEDVENRLNASRGRGSPLPRDTRHFMESRFGNDFAGVRVHTDSPAHELNRDVNSLAFTTGKDIYFAPGQFQPNTAAGRRLLAHELTHVVQQIGSSGPAMVREKSEPSTIARTKDPTVEEKEYYTYYDKYQSHRFRGKDVHGLLENILIKANPEALVTEAAIPGAHRDNAALNLIGRADLYESTPAHTVSGIRGYKEIPSKEKVVAMHAPEKIGTKPLKQIKKSPTRPTGPTGDFAGDFPSSIRLGEIKPLAVGKVREGRFQLQMYETGYNEFVKRIRELSGYTRDRITFSRLTGLNIPRFVNFTDWATEHPKESKSTEFPKEGQRKDRRRLWLAEINDGLYVYFDLSTDKDAAVPPEITRDLEKAHALRNETVRDKANKPIPPDPMTPISGKFLPGGPNPRLTRLASSPSGERTIQRHTKDRDKDYWPKRGREWESKRAAWGKDFRTRLKTKNKSYKELARIEKKLGKKGRKLPRETTHVKQYNQLMFWSGFGGKFFGKVRFFLGATWDKIVGLFERMKEKMHGVRSRVHGVTEGGVLSKLPRIPGSGWMRTLTKVLLAAAKKFVVVFVTESFNFFARCFHAAMDKVMEKLQTEITEALAVKLCEYRKLYEDSKAKLETEWGGAITAFEGIVETIQSAKHWIDVGNAAISTIRLVVQLISCLTPPGLGCLWGLVAQFAIGEALDFIIDSPEFNEKIVTPAVRDLVAKYATPKYQALINDALGEGLKEFHCQLPAGKPFPQLDQAVPTGGLSKAELVARRDKWEAAHQDEMLKDLGRVFEKPNGKKPTKEELLELAEQLKQRQQTPEELQKLIEQARNPATGKLKFDVVEANIVAGEAPEVAPKKRKIDYPWAAKRNVSLQREIGWDPLTFLKKPGVDVSSEEFADAVYDMQKAIRIEADGILGADTLKAFYDRNKLKKDKAYEAALRMQAARQAEKEKRAKEAEERSQQDVDRVMLGPKASASDTMAIPIPKPGPGVPVYGRKGLSPGPGSHEFSLPLGVLTGDLRGRASYDVGELVSFSVRLWIDRKWVWFNGIPGEFRSMSRYLDSTAVLVKVEEDLYFKLSSEATAAYVYSPALTKDAYKAFVLE